MASGLCSGHGCGGCQGSCGGSGHVVRQTEVLARLFYITSAQNWIRNLFSFVAVSPQHTNESSWVSGVHLNFVERM